MIDQLVLGIAKQGLGFTLATLAGFMAYKKDRQVSKLNLRVLKLVLDIRELEDRMRHKASR